LRWSEEGFRRKKEETTRKKVGQTGVLAIVTSKVAQTRHLGGIGRKTRRGGARTKGEGKNEQRKPNPVGGGGLPPLALKQEGNQPITGKKSS